jgi:hypothetical protein
MRHGMPLCAHNAAQRAASKPCKSCGRAGRCVRHEHTRTDAYTAANGVLASVGLANGLASFTGCLPDDGFQSAIFARARAHAGGGGRRCLGARASSARRRCCRARAPLRVRSRLLLPPRVPARRCGRQAGKCAKTEGHKLMGTTSAQRSSSFVVAARRAAVAMAPAPDYDAEKGAPRLRARRASKAHAAPVPARKTARATPVAHAATPRRVAGTQRNAAPSWPTLRARMTRTAG